MNFIKNSIVNKIINLLNAKTIPNYKYSNDKLRYVMMLRLAILTVVGTFGQFNDPVVVNNEIIRRLDNYDKAAFE